MRRRQLLTLLCGAAATAASRPRAARAQPTTMPVIGYLRSSSFEGDRHRIAGLRQGLSEAGYIEGESVKIESRSAEGRLERLPALAAELIQRQVAVIVANGVAARAAKAVTATVPIVFATGADPVRAGLVDSIGRPGRNVTGVTFLSSTIAAKQLGLLVDLVPRVAVIAALMDPGEAAGDAVLQDVQAAGHAIGRRIVVGKPGGAGDIEAAFAMFARERADALFVQGGPLLTNQRGHIVALAARHALPAMHPLRESVDVGGLISYGPSQGDAYRQAGIYVGRILKGAKPADLPVMLPTKFELVINLKTAKTLGLTVPSGVMAIADEVIE